jgi:AraC-like DNA-binding protein
VEAAPLARQRRTRREEPLAPRGDLRVGPLRPIPALLAEHGLDPEAVLTSAGIPPHILDDPENRLPFGVVGRLLEQCVEAARCPHFGLLVGQRFTLDGLGLLGQLMRNSPTLRDALRLATLHLEIHDRGAVSLTLDLGASHAALGYSLFDGAMPGADQILDGSIAIHYRIFRELCGPSWRPAAIRLSHSTPRKIAPFRRFFGPNLEFDADISAVVFDSRWLERPIAGADPARFAAIVGAIDEIQSRSDRPFAGQVRRALHALMFTGAASTTSVARLFGLRERTLRRRLEAEGATVRGLVGAVRRDLAFHLLRNTSLSVTEIAAILRYADIAVFGRAFRGWTGASPKVWRALHATRG